MTRRYILAYLPGTKVCPWSQYREAFVARFHELFGEPTMAAYQKLADRLQCSEDTIRRLYIGQEDDRHVFPKSGVLPELEKAMEMAPGSLGGSFLLAEAPQEAMPLGADLDEATPSQPIRTSGFYEVSLDRIASQWALLVLRNLPRNLAELSAGGKLPVYLESAEDRIRMVVPYLPAGGHAPWSGIFMAEERDRLMLQAKPIDAGKAFLIGAVTRDILIAEAVEKTLGTAKMDDVLAQFRGEIGTLGSIADELKVLQVDAEDLVEANKGIDLKMEHVAKRIRSTRRKLTDVLAKF